MLQKLTLSHCIYMSPDLGLSTINSLQYVCYAGLADGYGLDNGQFDGRWTRNLLNATTIVFDDSISNMTSLSS